MNHPQRIKVKIINNIKDIFHIAIKWIVNENNNK